MKNDDLPAPGTRWGDIPPEVRERLPAGTRLDAIPGREWSLPITRMVHGGWFDDLGTRAPCDVHPARPILSYPTDAGTPKPTDPPTYPRASMDEPPASITPPPGWEWAGEWAPSGAMTADDFPIWRRAVRRVAK